MSERAACRSLSSPPALLRGAAGEYIGGVSDVREKKKSSILPNSPQFSLSTRRDCVSLHSQSVNLDCARSIAFL